METIAPPTDTDATTATRDTNGTVKYPTPLAPGEREAMLQSVITSQAIEGVHISYEVAERLLDEVLREPLPHID